MAQATVTKGGKVFVFIGNNANPVVYKAPCGLTSRSLSVSKNLNETSIPDCDDPDAPDWLGRDVASLSMSVSGEGVLAEQSVETWLDALYSGEAVKVKVECVFPTKKITFTGEMHLESFEITAPRGQVVTANVSMQSDGEMTKLIEQI